MTILIEAISVVVRVDSLELLGSEILDRFYSYVSNNRTYYSDGKLARVGFLVEQDALDLVSFMESLGLVRLDGNTHVDFAILLQGQNDSVPCKWLERSVVNYQERLLDVATFVDEKGNIFLEENPGGFVAADGWSVDEAIVYHESQDDLKYLKSEPSEDGGILDHYLTTGGQTVYKGRLNRWFDLPVLCLLRMPLRLCAVTSVLGAAFGMIFIAGDFSWIISSFFGGLFGLVLCSQFAKEFPMTPLWIRKILGG